MADGTLVSADEAARLPVVLVLASGRGQRFLASGGITDKLQADLNGKTVLQHTLDAVRASGLRWHLEDAGHPGMGDSIAAAVRATRNAADGASGGAGWMVLPADLPLVQPATLVAIARAPLAADVLVPECGGQRGHPVRFAASCGGALADLHGNHGAARVVTAQAAIKIVVADAGCVTDIDTVDDLRRAGELLRQRALPPTQEG